MSLLSRCLSPGHDKDGWVGGREETTERKLPAEKGESPLPQVFLDREGGRVEVPTRTLGSNLLVTQCKETGDRPSPYQYTGFDPVIVQMGSEIS